MLNINTLNSYLKDNEFEKLSSELFPVKIFRLTDEDVALCNDFLLQVPDEIMEKSPILCTISTIIPWQYGDPSSFHLGEKWQSKLNDLLASLDKTTLEYSNLHSLLLCTDIVKPTTDNKDLFYYLSMLYNDHLTKKDKMMSFISTVGFPSVIRGSKDLSDLCKNYTIFKNLLKPIVDVLVGESGEDCIRAAVAEILYEKNLLNEAHLEVASSLNTIDPEIKFVSLVNLIKIARLENKNDPIITTTLNELEEFLKLPDNLYMLPNFYAFKVRLAIENGDIDSINKYLEKDELDVSDRRLSSIYRVITKAKCFIALNRYREAINILQGVIAAYEDRNRPMDIAECYINSAIALSLSGTSKLAMRHFERAVNITNDNEFIRVFADLGDVLLPIIDDYLVEFEKTSYIDNIYKEASMFSKIYPDMYNLTNENQSLDGTEELTSEISSANMLEDLSKTELIVLSHLSDGLSNNDISEKMDIKLSTVKFHVKNILSKFKASNRTEAVKIGRRFGYLD